ncbi:hypothetical protein KCTC52924_02866 [Arenibacter antarcticus]
MEHLFFNHLFNIYAIALNKIRIHRYKKEKQTIFQF